MQTADKKERQSTVSSGAKNKADAGAARSRSTSGQPWYAGQYKDALLYLMIAIFFVELVVGGVAFFYGVMHAAPEVPGGPPAIIPAFTESRPAPCPLPPNPWSVN